MTNMTDASRTRERAGEVRRLASLTYDESVRALMLSYADQLEGRAADAEDGSPEDQLSAGDEPGL